MRLSLSISLSLSLSLLFLINPLLTVVYVWHDVHIVYSVMWGECVWGVVCVWLWYVGGVGGYCVGVLCSGVVMGVYEVCVCVVWCVYMVCACGMYMYVVYGLYMCMSMCMWYVVTRGWHLTSSLMSLHLTYWGRVSHLKLWLVDLTTLVSHLVLDLSLLPRRWDYHQAVLPVHLLHGGWGFDLRSSCLYSKCFVQWAVSPAPQSAKSTPGHMNPQ